MRTHLLGALAVACASVACARSTRGAARPSGGEVVEAAQHEDAGLRQLRIRAHELLRASGDSNPVTTPDGKSVVFVSTGPRGRELVVASLGDPGPRHFGDTTPDVLGALVTDRSIVLLHDDGRRMFVREVSLDGKSTRDVATFQPGLTCVRWVGGPSGALYLTGRPEGHASPGIYRDRGKGLAPEELLWDPDPLELVDSAEHARLLVIRRHGPDDDQVLLLEASSRKVRVLFPPKGTRVDVEAAAISDDGRTLYVASNLRGEQGTVLQLDVASGSELRRHVEEGRWTSVTGLDLWGDRLLVRVHLGDRSVLRVLRAATLEVVSEVKLPVGSGAWRTVHEGRALVEWWTADTPGAIWFVDVETGAVRPLRDPGVVRPRGVPALETRHAEVVSDDGLALPVLAILPVERTARLPVIVHLNAPGSFVGSGWDGAAAFFASLGYAWVEPAVRGAGGHGRAFYEAARLDGRLRAVEDVEAIGRWVAAQAWADPDRLVLEGEGWGGHLALASLAAAPRLWRAGVEAFAPVDVRDTMSRLVETRSRAEVGTPWRTMVDGLVAEVGDPKMSGDLLDALSPLRRADRMEAPLFVLAGREDPISPLPQSEALASSLRARGVPVELEIVSERRTALGRPEAHARYLALAARFLETHAASRNPGDQIGGRARSP